MPLLLVAVTGLGGVLGLGGAAGAGRDPGTGPALVPDSRQGSRAGPGQAAVARGAAPGVPQPSRRPRRSRRVSGREPASLDARPATPLVEPAQPERLPGESRLRHEDPDRQLLFEELHQLALRDGRRAAQPLADYVLSAADETREAISCLTAIALLGDMQPEVSGAELRRIHADADGELRFASARALERQGDARAMRGEMLSMERDFLCSDGSERFRIARRAARLGSASALPLLRTMMSDASEAIRLEAASGLAGIDHAQARAELELARLDGDEDVRLRAEELLRARAPASPR